MILTVPEVDVDEFWYAREALDFEFEMCFLF